MPVLNKLTKLITHPRGGVAAVKHVGHVLQRDGVASKHLQALEGPKPSQLCDRLLYLFK